MALGVVAFCAIPILLIAISYGVLRKHILRDHLRFVRFKAFSKPLAQANWAMGKEKKAAKKAARKGAKKAAQTASRVRSHCGV